MIELKNDNNIDLNTMLTGAWHDKSFDRFTLVSAAIAPLRSRLLNHEVYGMLTNVQALRIFMEHHCYAVWDFMALLKCLQHQLTCVKIFWTPPSNMKAARMINEIVIAEETDMRRDSRGYASHFDLYIDAMAEIGADTDTVGRFVDFVAEGMPCQDAMGRANVPASVVPFVTQTLKICFGHAADEVAAFFVFGRENLIPDMFRQIVTNLAAADGLQIDGFQYYLDRHISIDEEEHGPAAVEMMRSLCGEDDTRWRIVQRAAQEALIARLNLWDGIAQAIRALKL